MKIKSSKFYIASVILLFSSCTNIIISKFYDIQKIKSLSSEEIVNIPNSELFNNDKYKINYFGYFDTFFQLKTINKSNTIVNFNNSRSLLLQPLTALYFDKDFRLISGLSNCYATPKSIFSSSLFWNSNDRLLQFPPLTHDSDLFTNVNFNIIIQNSNIFSITNNSDTLFKQNFDYYIVCTYCVFMGKQTVNFINSIMENSLLASKKSKICILMILKDNLLFNELNQLE